MSDRSAWTTATVRNLIVHHASGPSPTCEERPINTSEEWGLLKTTAVTWDGWDATAHKVPPHVYWGKTWLEVHAGDVLITKAGPRERCGVTVYVTDTPPRLMVSGKMILLRPNPAKVNATVLSGVLATEKCQRYLDSRTTGMADSQLNFTNELLLSMVVDVPPLPEQYKIARILTTLDNLIEKTESLIAKYQAIKQGMMHDLFTRGVDAHGHLRPPQAEAPDLYKQSAVGWIPKEWTSPTVGQVLVQRPKNGYSPKESDEWTGTLMLGLGCLTPSGFEPIQLKHAPKDDPNLTSALLTDGDLLISRSNTRDLVALVGIYRDIGTPCIYSDLMMRLVPTNDVLPEYLESVLRHAPVRRQLTNASCGTSGSMMKINAEMVVNTVLSLPLKNEQQRILDRVASIGRSVTQARQELEKLRVEKTGLMQDLLTGKVRVKVDEAEEVQS